MRRRGGANEDQPRGDHGVFALIGGPALAFVLLRWWGGSSVFAKNGVWMFLLAGAVFGFSLSLWMLFAMPWLLGVFRAPSKWIRQDRERKGLCGGCGYDLRVGHAQCPECGEQVRSE